MVPADEYDLRKSSLLSFFNQIEDSIIHRIANILTIDWHSIHILISENSFQNKVSTYKRSLAALPQASQQVERDRRFWQMIDDLRIARNAIAHGSQFFLTTEDGLQHVYARASQAFLQQFDQVISVDAIKPASELASTISVILQALIVEDTACCESIMPGALKRWEQLKTHLPAGRSPKWPPRATKSSSTRVQ